MLEAWTDTLDVLKPSCPEYAASTADTWTDTLDVLKRRYGSGCGGENHHLNRHIGCIETRDTMGEWQIRSTWTDTLDVLKLPWKKAELWKEELEPTHWMYWNFFMLPSSCLLLKLEPTHWMYWNKKDIHWRSVKCSLEPTHWMYWNLPINNAAIQRYTWTDTLDVLKHWNHPSQKTDPKLEPTHWMYWNRYTQTRTNRAKTWTDTLDVLKLGSREYFSVCSILEPTHWMYWNRNAPHPLTAPTPLEPTHWMYWNWEIERGGRVERSTWTDTLDVLKHGFSPWI